MRNRFSCPNQLQGRSEAFMQKEASSEANSCCNADWRNCGKHLPDCRYGGRNYAAGNGNGAGSNRRNDCNRSGGNPRNSGSRSANGTFPVRKLWKLQPQKREQKWLRQMLKLERKKFRRRMHRRISQKILSRHLSTGCTTCAWNGNRILSA